MFIPTQVIDYDANGQAAMAYVQYAEQNTVALSAFHFRKGYALPDEVGADLPVALVTFNGATPLANIPNQADGVSASVKLNDVVFAKGEVWSGDGALITLGTSDQVSQYSVTIGANLGSHFQIQGEEIRATESSGFLGAYGSGGFSTADGSHVDLHGVSIRTHFGGFGAFASYRAGVAASNFSNSILNKINADISQAAAGLMWRNARNAVALAYSQPLHVTGGDMNLKLATGRTDSGAVTYANPTVVLNEGIKQANYEIGYTRLVGQYAKVGLNLIYVKNPANEPGFDHDLGAMVMIGVRI
ncbi:hypothetical protein [Halothiobacillus sp.]|uniref:hypothetical protein n=1 Tax=Halothiobacillus sp. TaxID=1891311 RepID=UPI002AD1FB43|nr:hypothetical protein [Halothiobacillus sp.]